MPNQELQNRFYKELEASKSFTLLTPEEQASLKNAFLNATDEQLQRGIDEIGSSNLEMQKLVARMEQVKQENVKLAENIKVELAKVEKLVLAKNAEKDKAESNMAAEALLTKIEELSSNEAAQTEPKKRKKFLGIF